jgi:hypothetical protein
MGMIHQVVPAMPFHETVTALAQNLAGKNQEAVGWSKATVNTLTRRQQVLRSDLLLIRE